MAPAPRRLPDRSSWRFVPHLWALAFGRKHAELHQFAIVFNSASLQHGPVNAEPMAHANRRQRTPFGG